MLPSLVPEARLHHDSPIGLTEKIGIPAMASSEQIVQKRRYYSVDEANKTLPLLRAIMEDIVRQNRIVEELQERLAGVKRDRRRPSRGSDPSYSEELEQTQAELEL